jgi:hypothetical protein
MYEAAMKLTELASFDVVREELSWPWVAFDSSGGVFAFPSSGSRIASRVLEHEQITEGPTFALPADLALPTAPPKDEASRDTRAGVHGFSVGAGGSQLAVTGVIESASVVVTIDAEGRERRSDLEALAGPGFVAQAVAFDRSGARLWISAESEKETALVLIDAQSHALVGIVKSAPFPPPAMHELHLHPQEDAVLLLAACGPDGTFARVARFGDGRVTAVWTALEGGGIPAGMVGFSADGSLVHLAEADELRTHAWPGLKELTSVQFDDDFVSSYSGALIGARILVDGQDSETKEDAVTSFDLTATKGAFLTPPVPSGMWAGRLGTSSLVTVEAKGEPTRGRVFRIAL